MRADVAYGIDYGTTNSSISLAYRDHVEVLSTGGYRTSSAAFPSLVYLHRNGLRLAGRQAAESFSITGNQQTRCNSCELVVGCEQFSRGGGCLDSRLMGEIKSTLTDREFQHTHSWGTDFQLEDLVAVIMSYLKRLADRRTGQHVTRAVIGYPIAFFGATGEGSRAKQLVAEERVEEAARRSGFTEVELYPEPAAVVLDEVLDDAYVVAVDFGGGTFDVAVTSVFGGEGEVLSLAGAAVGGAILDRLIFEEKVAECLGLNEPFVPAWFRSGLASLESFKYIMNHRYSFSILDLSK